VADGIAFAFREQAEDTFTLPGLVANGTMPPEAAGFLSVAIERNAAALIAGTRGAGKTTLLGTLLYEVTPDTRTVVIEDTPELPVNQLQIVDRDVQALRTGTGEGPEITPADALRTALRLGDGALVVGEIRGEEARVLYEAMRVGANANAVLGTIHGDGADEVFERVVSDLGVPASSFGATDLVVTVQAYQTPEGRKRRLSAIEEVIVGEDETWFAPLYEIDEDKARSTDRIDRGESRFVDRLTGPAEEYADIRQAIQRRGEKLDRLAKDGRTAPSEVAASYAGRGME
jgi:type IV secretory pathway ATPase VirB11/archaellum biosynthesis ATPase